MKNNRRLIRKLTSAVVVFTAVTTSAVYAGGFFGGGFHRGDMMKPIERMIEHIDLSDEQDAQVEAILKNAREGLVNKGETRQRFFKQMIDNNPDDLQYMAIAEEQAEAISVEVKKQILRIANVRQQVYEVLTVAQKEELAEHIDRKMEKMKNRAMKHGH